MGKDYDILQMLVIMPKSKRNKFIQDSKTLSRLLRCDIVTALGMMYDNHMNAADINRPKTANSRF